MHGNIPNLVTHGYVLSLQKAKDADTSRNRVVIELDLKLTSDFEAALTDVSTISYVSEGDLVDLAQYLEAGVNQAPSTSYETFLTHDMQFRIRVFSRDLLPHGLVSVSTHINIGRNQDRVYVGVESRARSSEIIGFAEQLRQFVGALRDGRSD